MADLGGSRGTDTIADRPPPGGQRPAGEADAGRSAAQVERVMGSGGPPDPASQAAGRYDPVVGSGRAADQAAAGGVADQAAAGRSVDQVQRQVDAGTGDQVRTFRTEDLTFDPANPRHARGHLLGEGGDKRLHAVGDDVRTYRREDGSVIDSATNRFATDTNRRPVVDGVHRSVPDHSTEVSYLPTGYSRGARWVNDAVAARDDSLKVMDEAWDRFGPQVQSLHDQGLIEAPTDKNGDIIPRRIGHDAINTWSTELSGAQRLEFLADGKWFVDTTTEAANRSHDLGMAGVELFVENNMPDATIIVPNFETSADRAAEPNASRPTGPGQPYTFDTLALTRREGDGGDPADVVAVIEGKGPVASLGVSKVDSPDGPGHPQHVAEQGSTPYIRQKFQEERNLGAHAGAAAADGADPALADASGKMVAAVRAGNVESWIVRTDATGKVTGYRTVIDTDQLRDAPINGVPNEGETR